MVAKLKKDSSHKGSSLDGIESKGGSQKPKTTEKKFKEKLNPQNKPGKKV